MRHRHRYYKVSRLETDRQRFNHLSSAAREVLVYKYGEFLMRSNTEYYRVDLYALRNQMVEVWWNRNTRLIENIYIPTLEEMDLHTDRINISIASLWS